MHLYFSFKVNQGGSIGIVLCSYWYEPYDDVPADQWAARRALAFDLAW